MVIIYSNENNPATLKLLVAKNIANISVQVKILSLHESSLQAKILPYLAVEDEGNHTFFSSNAALCFILPPKENATDIYNWLEWEATELAPNLALLLGSSSKNVKLRDSISTALTTLNKHLQINSYLAGGSLSSADIAVWSVLYPLTTCTKTTSEYLDQQPKLAEWISNLRNETSFKEAISAFKIDSNSYIALLVGAKYLLPPNFNDVSKTENFNYIKDKESPQHNIETVTEEEKQAAQNAWKKSASQKLKSESKCVLPVAGEKNVLITSALPYVNNVPHLGNIIGCVLSADVFARYSRLCNNNTLFICGTDEYGTATETKALEEGLSCKEICDKYHKVHSEIYKWFNISFDHFGRTSEPEQTKLCQEMFLTLNSNGFMFTESVEQLHCEKCNKFLADRFVEGGCPNIGCNYEDARGDQCDGCGKLVNAVELKNPRCKICGHTPKLKSSNQFFIDLPKLEPLVRHWIQLSGPGWSSNAQVIAKSWLKEGLKPRCITRDLKWGVPVPLDGFRNKVFYVWFDAPIGYLSISKAYSKDFEKWWIPSQGTKVTLYQFMAKDNVPFHSVLFPAMLLGANKGYTTVSHLMATEYLNYEDGKFSKSRGVGVFGTDAQSTGIPSDVWRFYLLYVRPETQDSSFSWNDLVTKNNSELLNNLGNFINRALMFAKNNFNKTVPKMDPNDDDYTLLALCTREYKSYVAAVGNAKLRDGIRHILAISRHGNQYMQANKPWVLLKGSDEDKLRAGTIIGICSNLACLLGTLLQPYMPDTSESLKKQLNASNVVIMPDNVEIVTMLPAGHQLGEPSPLFAKIEPDQAEKLKKKFAGTQTERKGNNEDLKIIEDQVAKQGDKVRALKSSGANKSLWQPEVAILLELKKKLEVALKSKPVNNSSGSTQQLNGLVNPQQLKKLEEEVAHQMNTWFKLFLCSALLGFVKAHHFVRAVILAALGLAGLWMVHTLAQDFSSIQNNINAGRDGDDGASGGGIGGIIGIRGLFKRSIAGTDGMNRPAGRQLIDWETVLSRDPAGCARSFLCQLAATKKELRSRDESLMLELVGYSTKEDSSASEQLQESLRNGERVEMPNQCMNIYKFCPYTSQTMMTLLKLFGR